MLGFGNLERYIWYGETQLDSVEALLAQSYAFNNTHGPYRGSAQQVTETKWGHASQSKWLPVLSVPHVPSVLCIRAQ